MPTKKADALKKADAAKFAVIVKKVAQLEKEMAAIVKAFAKVKGKRA
jgi:hypothetical protein